MRKRGAGYDGNRKKGKECKIKRKHQGKKTLCCMEQPSKQRWKEQKTRKRREKGENLVYLLALCPGNSLPSSIFYLFLWYLPIFLCFSFPPPALTSFTSFFSLHPGGPLLLFNFFTFPLSLWHLLFMFLFSFFWLQSGSFLSCTLFILTPTF